MNLNLEKSPYKKKILHKNSNELAIEINKIPRSPYSRRSSKIELLSNPLT